MPRFFAQAAFAFCSLGNFRAKGKIYTDSAIFTWCLQFKGQKLKMLKTKDLQSLAAELHRAEQPKIWIKQNTLGQVKAVCFQRFRLEASGDSQGLETLAS